MQTKSGANCNQLYHTLESVHSVQPSLIPDSSCSEETGTSHLTKSKEISFANTTKKLKSAELIERLGLLCRQGSINYYLFSGYGNSQRPSLPDHKRSRRNQRIVHAISSLQSKVIRTALSSLYCTLWSVWLEELPPTSRSLLVLLLSSLCPLRSDRPMRLIWFLFSILKRNTLCLLQQFINECSKLGLHKKFPYLQLCLDCCQ